MAPPLVSSMLHDNAKTEDSKPFCRVKVLKLSDNIRKIFGFSCQKMGGSAKPEPRLLKFGGPEPLGPIEVYAYVITIRRKFDTYHQNTSS